jgi:FixJ family two-component response regulator
VEGHRVAKEVSRTVVFVVDDDDSVRKSLGRLIRSEGFEVHLFDSSEGFLEAVTPTLRACVVLDVSMPSISGIDVQHRLNERGMRMPVIIVSARDDDLTRSRAKQCGAKFFFRKPVDERALIDAIDWAANSDPDTAG